MLDADGQIIGYFIPPPADPIIPWEPFVTQEEIERRRKGSGRTWAEIREELLKL